METIMAKNPNPLADLSSETKQAVDQTKEQVLGAVDKYFNFLLQTISSYPSGGTDLGEKLKSYAEKNIAATQQFIHRLSQAKDFPDIIRIQTEFMQAQMDAFSGQTKNLGGEFSKATGAVKPPFKTSLE
jgi:hypothetical protein